MKILCLLCLVMFVSPAWADEQESATPNIVIINIDDMGWRDVGFMGSEYYDTPNIDALAGLGMVFTNGYASASNCAPSRACLMTGQWTPRHGVYTVSPSTRGKSKDRKLIPTPNTHTLPPIHRILPQVLQENGYQTCHAGKWHLSDDPLAFGFDVNIGGSHAGMPLSYYPPYKNVNIEGSGDQYLTDAIMEKTLEFINEVQEPFFLYYSPYAVHTPIMPVKHLLPKYNNRESSNGQGNAAYASMVENLDRNIGLLIEKLKAKGLFENTLIVFTSDNGGLFGVTRQKPLRAGKGSYYEGGIRVPFFFVFNERIKSPKENNVPISNLDLFPTILDFAGIEDSNLALDGDSLKPLLLSQKETLDRALYWHFPIYLQSYNVDENETRDPLFRTRPGSVVRKGDWKLHYYFEDQGIELYNLREDVGERKNLANSNPEKSKELLALLEDWWVETDAPIPARLNPEFRE